MKSLLISLLLVFLFSLTSEAQDRNRRKIDSLIEVVTHYKKEDTVRFRALNYLSRRYLRTATSDSSLYYAEEALALAKKINFQRGMAIANRRIGNYYYSDQSDFEKAEEYYQRSLAISELIDDKNSMYNILYNLGLIYGELYDFPKSLDYYGKALAVAEEMDDPELEYECHYSLAFVYGMLANYPEALESYQKALNIGEKLEDRRYTAIVFHNMGALYISIDDTLKARQNLENALEIYRQIDDQENISLTLNNIGSMYQNAKDYDKALEYFLQVIDISKKLEDETSLGLAYTNVASLYAYRSNFKKAVTYHQMAYDLFNQEHFNTYYSNLGMVSYLKEMGYLIEKAPDSILESIGIDPMNRNATAVNFETRALEIADEINDLEQKLDIWSYLIPMYVRQGNYKEAYYHNLKARKLEDSIHGQESKREIYQKEVQYAFDKKAMEAEAEQAKKDIRHRNIRNSLYGGLSGLFLFSSLLFWQRNKVKREKKRSDDLLLNILPVAVAEELKENGKAAARRHENITVLFTDFVNFTGTSEKLTPEELVGELNECFTEFDHIIEKNGLEKIKTIGDAYMAVCGLPSSREDHAQRAIRAAFEILEFMYQRSLKADVFDIRIGINSGPVVAGIVGVNKFAYDIWGDTVNTAARMEQNSEPGRVNISERTYQLVKDDFEFSYRGEIEAKHKGKLKMYFVEDPKKVSSKEFDLA